MARGVFAVYEQGLFMDQRQCNIAKKALCKWLSESGEMSLFRTRSPKVIENRAEFAFAITVEEHEFGVFRFDRSIYASEAQRIGVAGGFVGKDDEKCTAFSRFDEFPKNRDGAEKLARKLAQYILKHNAEIQL